jgi:hypothetical protein
MNKPTAIIKNIFILRGTKITSSNTAGSASIV